MTVKVRKIALHLILIAAITALVVLCIVYPFLPGNYDGLALALSTMAQLFGLAGLLLVPVGVLWLLKPKSGYALAVASVMVGSLAAAAVSLAALATLGPALGFAVLILWVCVVWQLAPILKRLKHGEAGGFNPAPLHLIVIPIAVLLSQILLAAPTTERSRNRAMERSASLIADIEAYHTTHGEYPVSMNALWPDYEPGVVGIERYFYTPSGEAYNLYFEEPTFMLKALGTREIVMYNPLDDQVFVSHDSDILRHPPEELAQRQGWHSVHDAPRPHWKYFWFD